MRNIPARSGSELLGRETDETINFSLILLLVAAH